MLRKLSHHVDVVENGEDARILASRKRYDLILMDWMMPQVNGLDATKSIRANNGPNKSTPIIALTANAMEGNKDACLEAGMNDYLSKPFNRSDLEGKICCWCSPYKKMPNPNVAYL